MKAEALQIPPRIDSKQSFYFFCFIFFILEKNTQKWKVVFLGGKKKISSNVVLNTSGNPQWDFECTVYVNNYLLIF